MKTRAFVRPTLAIGACAASSSAPRTPWGEPDIQGLWTSEPELGVPFERSKELGDRQTLKAAR